MWSSRSRFRLASHASIRWCRERPASFGPRAHREASLGGHEDAVAAPLEDLADDLLGQAARIDVGRVDQVDPGVERHVDLAAGSAHVVGADIAKLALTSETHRPERQLRDA